MSGKRKCVSSCSVLELREAFEAEAQEVKKARLLLTAAVPVGPDNVRGGYDVPAVASYLDFINLMAYDFHGKWERETGHNAPLYAPSTDSEWRKQLSVDHAANMWVKMGAPKDKLVIGMPTYGRTFTLSNPEVFRVNAPASGGGKAGDYTKEGGFLAYYEVCDMLRNGASYIWDEEMKVPYAVQGDQWVGFDDERSIRNKMKWIKDGGFGGAMVWTVDMDDFTGDVCGGGVKYPLITAMRCQVPAHNRQMSHRRQVPAHHHHEVIHRCQVPTHHRHEVSHRCQVPAHPHHEVSHRRQVPAYHHQVSHREELRGVSRGANVKDIDWSKIANAILVEAAPKPAAIKIPVGEVLKRVRGSTHRPTALQTNVNTRVRAPQVFCYMTSWSQKRPGAGKFTPDNIDATLCTHVIYAFATLKDHKLAPGDEKDIDMYEKVVALREKNPDIQVRHSVVGDGHGLDGAVICWRNSEINRNFRQWQLVLRVQPILLAIGGWAFGSTPFKELTSNVFRMNQFVYEAIELLREYKFNGLDVDWEYPRGADDRAAYVNLLKELRLAFEGETKTSGEPRLLLTAAVPASFEAIAAGYDVPEISKYLDFINVMTYDFHGQWERQVGHNSPLFPLESTTSYQKKLTVDFSAREWVKQGAPKEKLMIGMPTYGRSFTLIDPTKFDIGAPASGGGVAGKYTGEAGFMSYYEVSRSFGNQFLVCDFLHAENTTLVWDNEQQVPFAYRKDQWVGFDDERSLKTKVNNNFHLDLAVVTCYFVSDDDNKEGMSWLKEEGFGGIMIWSVDMDDFRGHCGTGKYPLINAMRQELDGYSVKLEYDGPYESYNPNGKYTTKNRECPSGGRVRKLWSLSGLETVQFIPVSSGSVSSNEVSCEEEEGHISYHKDRADCTMYYMCEGERKHHMPCPSNLVFNPNENVCDWPENVEGCQHHTPAPPTAKRR
uniref:Chitinase n=1 Tax=Timema tahoe TaxID=61484 RepID=A0A7R9IBB1_9NEOP|nr:unnamed protein product [Timema tahoe]